jgi:hypothetical protein
MIGMRNENEKNLIFIEGCTNIYKYIYLYVYTNIYRSHMMGMRNENDESIQDPDSPVGKQYNSIIDTLNAEEGSYIYVVCLVIFRMFMYFYIHIFSLRHLINHTFIGI